MRAVWMKNRGYKSSVRESYTFHNERNSSNLEFILIDKTTVF